MKMLRKSLVVLVALFILAFPANKAFADASSLIDLARFLPLGIKSLAALFSGSGSGSDSEIKSIEKDGQQYVIERHKKEGRIISFGSLHEKVIVNKQAVVLTYNAKVNGKETVISLGLIQKEDKIYHAITLLWDDLAEYKANSSKKFLATCYAKYGKGLNVGPVDEEDSVKTATAESKPETPAPTASAPAPTVPVQPQTPPTVATAPEPKAVEKAVAPDASAKNPSEVLKELKKMKDDGLITPEEYDAKKKEILSKM